MNTFLKGSLLVGLATAGLATAAWAYQANHGFNPASLDTDRDGVISSAELDTHADLLFARTDRDSNGTLSADELRALHAMLAAGTAPEHTPDQATRPLTRQAFREGLRGHATQMDGNRDGRLTIAELNTAMHGSHGH